MEYYIIINGKQHGPYAKADLLAMGLTRETLVWKAGMPDWKPADEIESLVDLFEDSAFGTYAEVPPAQPESVQSEPNPKPYDPRHEQTAATLYHAMLNGVQTGSLPIAELIARGLNRDTQVWCEGMQNWAPAFTRPDIVAVLNATPRNPYPFTPQNPTCQPQPQYGQFNAPKRSAWLTWAIVGTIFGFLCSCIGGIFGIIGIVNANKANTAWAMGDNATAESAESTAKTMTIISLVFVAIGILSNIVLIGSIFD